MPDIVEDPKNQSDVIGSNVTLNCTATGRPPPTITWIKNDSWRMNWMNEWRMIHMLYNPSQG